VGVDRHSVPGWPVRRENRRIPEPDILETGMSKPEDPANTLPAEMLKSTLVRLADAIERLNGLVEQLAAELAEPPGEALSFEGDPLPDWVDGEPETGEEPAASPPPRILH
jgi:hypothetical protein